MKILVVEDDAALNRGISLSVQGETVLSAYSLKEAETLLDETVDLMILDINLPDGNGLDYCRKVRETSDVPIIFLTANDLETDVVAGLESGGAAGTDGETDGKLNFLIQSLVKASRLENGIIAVTPKKQDVGNIPKKFALK